MFILGHRGAIIKTAAFSQNSLPAFKLAMAECDGFETDACLSKDGDVFLIHASDDGHGFGAYLDAPSAAHVGVRRLSQFSSDTLHALRLAKGQTIPILQQAIELVGRKKGKILNIEIKGYGAVLPVLDIVQKCLREKRIKSEALIFSSFDHAALKKVRAKFPKIKIGALCVSPSEHGKKIYPSEKKSSALYTTISASVLASPLLCALQPEIFIVPEKMMTKKTLATVERAFPKAQLAGWTVTEKRGYDQADLIKRLKSLPLAKIAAMIVDNPKMFVQAMRNG